MVVSVTSIVVGVGVLRKTEQCWPRPSGQCTEGCKCAAGTGRSVRPAMEARPTFCGSWAKVWHEQLLGEVPWLRVFVFSNLSRSGSLLIPTPPHLRSSSWPISASSIRAGPSFPSISMLASKEKGRGLISRISGYLTPPSFFLGLAAKKNYPHPEQNSQPSLVSICHFLPRRLSLHLLSSQEKKISTYQIVACRYDATLTGKRLHFLISLLPAASRNVHPNTHSFCAPQSNLSNPDKSLASYPT